MKKRSFILSFVIAIVVAVVLAIGMGVLCFAIGSGNEDFQPWLSYIFAIGAGVVLYWRLSEAYDKKLAIIVGATTFVVLSVIFGLLQVFSHFAIMVVEAIAWSLITLTIEALIIYKVFGISKDDYQKLD